MDQLMTLEVLKTFAGATAAVLAVVEAIKKAVEAFTGAVDNRVWIGLALAVSFLVCFGPVILAGGEALDYVFAFFNSFAVFGSATAGIRAAKKHMSDKL